MRRLVRRCLTERCLALFGILVFIQALVLVRQLNGLHAPPGPERHYCLGQPVEVALLLLLHLPWTLLAAGLPAVGVLLHLGYLDARLRRISAASMAAYAILLACGVFVVSGRHREPPAGATAVEAPPPPAQPAITVDTILDLIEPDLNLTGLSDAEMECWETAAEACRENPLPSPEEVEERAMARVRRRGLPSEGADLRATARSYYAWRCEWRRAIRREAGR